MVAREEPGQGSAATWAAGAVLPATLCALRDDPGHAAVFLDYDGSLAPIVADPAAAAPWPGVPELLSRLGGRMARVVVVSGRPGRFLAATLGLHRGVDLFGLYGMERVASDGSVVVDPSLQDWRGPVEEIRRRAEHESPPGVHVEPKGLSVTLHWRADPGSEPWVEEFARQAEDRAGLLGQRGRMSIELRPPVHTDKGTVVREIGAGYRATCYFGDDLGDLAAFRALDELAELGLAVTRVAVVDAESPAQVVEAADLLVAGPGGAVDLLEELVTDRRPAADPPASRRPGD